MTKRLSFEVRAVIALLILLLAGWLATFAFGDEGETEVERLRTDLRLRTAELAVTRRQITVCERRGKR